MRPGDTRIALLAVLQAGVVGTFDAIAVHAGIPAHKASVTLRHLSREGHAQPVASVATGGVGRPRVVYAATQGKRPPFDSLAFACQVWR